MKNIKILRIAQFLFVILIVIPLHAQYSCENDEPLNKNYSCLSYKGKTVPVKVDYKGPEGVWISQQDYSIKYNYDGTGYILFTTQMRDAPSPQNFKWGVIVNSETGLPVESDYKADENHIYKFHLILHEGTNKEIDAHLVTLRYFIEQGGHLWDLRKGDRMPNSYSDYRNIRQKLFGN